MTILTIITCRRIPYYQTTLLCRGRVCVATASGYLCTWLGRYTPPSPVSARHVNGRVPGAPKRADPQVYFIFVNIVSLLYPFSTKISRSTWVFFKRSWPAKNHLLTTFPQGSPSVNYTWSVVFGWKSFLYYVQTLLWYARQRVKADFFDQWKRGILK